MPTGVFCGVTPFFFRKKSELKARNETKKYASKKVRSSKSSKVQSPSRLSGNLVAMAELSSKISSFRDLLDFSPCLGSASVNELIILTLNDLFKCYPKIKPKSELQGASLHKALKILCGTLKSLGDLWTTKKWMVKCKYKSFKKLGHVELEQTALAMLDDIINLARERRFHVMDDDGDMKLRGYSPQSIASREAMSEYSENRTPFSASPETPTSVLQGTWKSASSREKGSCSPPLLVPPRVQAVGKLNRIDVKRLSFHMNPHVISLAQDPKYAILMNSIETEEPPSEMRPGNVIKEDVDDEKISGEMEMDNVDNRESEMKCESPRIAATGSVGKVDNDGRKLPALEASEEQEMHVRLSSSPPELPQNAAEQVAPPSLPTDQNISPSSPPSPPPTPITPRNLVPARLPPTQPPPPFPVPSGNTESPPPPPPLTALMNCVQPPPPPPMATSNGVEPSPPTLKSTAPPPPPPPTSITNGNGAAPPPPPPPTSISNGNGATPPPPPPPPPMGASKENGAAPPPPPMASASKGFEGMAPPPPGVLFLRPKKLATKLKRSSHIGNLYRVLKGKVEGSGLESKLSGRKGNAGGGGGGGGAGGGAAGGKQGMADALAEMTKRSAYFIQIEEDVKNYADNIKELKAKISSFQTSDMTELIQFHKYVESHLEKLADETQVLARFEDFPSKKLEALRMAAALYSKLDSIVATLQNWPIDEPVGKLLDKAESFFNKIKVDIDALERTKDDEAKRFQAQKITFDFGILLQIKELMVDVSSICMESALKEKEEAMDKDNKDGNPEKKKNEIAKILWRAFQFAFRVYTFAGGHDERADKLTRELAHEIEKEN